MARQRSRREAHREAVSWGFSESYDPDGGYKRAVSTEWDLYIFVECFGYLPPDEFNRQALEKFGIEFIPVEAGDDIFGPEADVAFADIGPVSRREDYVLTSLVPMLFCLQEPPCNVRQPIEPIKALIDADGPISLECICELWTDYPDPETAVREAFGKPCFRDEPRRSGESIAQRWQIENTTQSVWSGDRLETGAELQAEIVGTASAIGLRGAPLRAFREAMGLHAKGCDWLSRPLELVQTAGGLGLS